MPPYGKVLRSLWLAKKRAHRPSWGPIWSSEPHSSQKHDRYALSLVARCVLLKSSTSRLPNTPKNPGHILSDPRKMTVIPTLAAVSSLDMSSQRLYVNEECTALCTSTGSRQDPCGHRPNPPKRLGSCPVISDERWTPPGPDLAIAVITPKARER